ncbi:MAG: cation:proton antiporter, partial [Candidatus Nanohaloarchaeota archaeon QJJ-9]|nr:cation:proton antiporter [Candidatus Nanohaloarchaeota archaeon QJJ-9]
MIFETTAIQGFAVLLFTATVLGFLAKKTKQPTIVAYIIAGLVLGPVGLSAVSGTELTDLFAELGLAFLLFLIGLEMRLDKIKEIIKPVTAIAMGQMAILAGI